MQGRAGLRDDYNLGAKYYFIFLSLAYSYGNTFKH